MASLDHINQSLSKVSKFLSPLLPLAGCHMVDFITDNHWENHVPPQMRDDLLQLPGEQAHLPNTSAQLNTQGIVDSSERWHFSSSDLSSFIKAIHEHCLPSLGITTAVEEVLKDYGSSEASTLQIKGIMSDKKSHEVEILSHVIARLAEGCTVDWIVDLGSGRGYLSSSLVLHHDLNVVAIDSSKSNTTSALARNKKLQRRWEKLKQNDHQRVEGSSIKTKEKHGREGNSKNRNEGKIEGVSPLYLKQSLKGRGRYIALTRFITDNSNLVQIVKDVIDEGSQRVKGPVTFDFEKVDKSESYKKTKNVEKDLINNVTCDSALKVNFKTDLELKENAEMFENSQILENSVDKYTFSGEKESCEGYVPHLEPEVKSSQVSHDLCLGLVGLHTCGNLASSSLQLFLSNPKVEFLCNVGCCYHLIEEEFSKNPFIQKEMSPQKEYDENHDPVCNISCEAKYESKLKSQPSFFIQDKTGGSTSGGQVHDSNNSTSKGLPLNPLHPSEIPNLDYGFPLSSTLKREKFALGRNSRMLSCQPADRLNQGKFNGFEQLYWRALLQLLLKDKIGDVSGMVHVGRIAAKCQGFPDYARMAFSKLGISIEVTQGELEQYHHKHLDELEKLKRFYLLRASIAPVIEGLILLDRMAFLCEQEDVSAHLVHLFDPIISPRCHGIIAIKNHQSYT